MNREVEAFTDMSIVVGLWKGREVFYMPAFKQN